MQLYTRPLDADAHPSAVLRALVARARRHHLPGPAALTGEWFGSSAVLAPSVAITPRESEFGPLDAADPPVSGDRPGAVGGGWIGYLGYPDRHAQPRRLPRTAWGWADHVLRRDRDGRWWFEALGAEPPPAELITELAGLVRTASAPATAHRSAPAGWTGTAAHPDGEQHRKAVRRCVAEIAAGEIFQANICCRFGVRSDAEPWEVFAHGSARFSPARAAYLAGPWGAVASLSPELFLRRTGREVRSRPIKGTLPRRGPADDANAEALRSSAKDTAENVMIVDMARNDLGRVAEVGTVTVPRLLEVEPHPGVWHLVSEVRAEVPADLPHGRLLRATFPPASVTGAPKPRAVQIIDELEAQPRGLYCGAIGMASPAAGMELNVAIRTLEHRDGEYEFGVGGGITADSDPDAEWQESLTKAAPQLAVLGAAER
ncbi:aminodeoxychorismate synthase component I [Salinifilum aidingensis]